MRSGEIMALEDTVAVRGGREMRHGAGAIDEGWPHAPPIDLSTTYGFHRSSKAADSLDRLIDGDAGAPNPIYGRLSNPNVSAFEHALAELEGTESAAAFATGMGAIAAVVLAACAASKPRLDGIVAVRPLYGGTDHLFESGLLGSTMRWVSEAEVGSAVNERTALVFIETPANPTLRLVDIEAVVAQTRSASERIGRPVPVVVDSTFATPVLQRPASQGADMVVHSATKFIGGHGDAMGGVVATTEAWARALRQVRTVTGGVLHPMGAYLLHRGLQTLPLRVRAQQESAAELARRLRVHPSVRRVYFPGIEADDRTARLLRSQQTGPGSVLSFEVDGGGAIAASVVESLRLITPAVSLGSVDTLIQAPALLTHRIVAPEDRAASGIPENLLRLSVGLEAVEDVWDDLDRALTSAFRSVA